MRGGGIRVPEGSLQWYGLYGSINTFMDMTLSPNIWYYYGLGLGLFLAWRVVFHLLFVSQLATNTSSILMGQVFSASLFFLGRGFGGQNKIITGGREGFVMIC